MNATLNGCVLHTVARYTGETLGGSDVAPREGEERIDVIFNGCVSLPPCCTGGTLGGCDVTPMRDSGGEMPHRKTDAMINAQTCGCLWAPKVYHVTTSFSFGTVKRGAATKGRTT